MQNPRKSRLILPNLFCFSESFPNRLNSSLVTPKEKKWLLIPQESVTLFMRGAEGVMLRVKSVLAVMDLAG